MAPWATGPYSFLSWAFLLQTLIYISFEFFMSSNSNIYFEVFMQSKLILDKTNELCLKWSLHSLFADDWNIWKKKKPSVSDLEQFMNNTSNLQKYAILFRFFSWREVCSSNRRLKIHKNWVPPGKVEKQAEFLKASAYCEVHTYPSICRTKTGPSMRTLESPQ